LVPSLALAIPFSRTSSSKSRPVLTKIKEHRGRVVLFPETRPTPAIQGLNARRERIAVGVDGLAQQPRERSGFFIV
jgi:hypothetical protein